MEKKTPHLKSTHRHQNKYKIHTWRGPPETSPLVLDIWQCVTISRDPRFLGQWGTATYFSQPTPEMLFLLCFGLISCVVYACLMRLLPVIKHEEMQHHRRHRSISWATGIKRPASLLSWQWKCMSEIREWIWLRWYRDCHKARGSVPSDS